MLIITAHPDDECYFAAGTVYANKLAGGTANLICATLGEKGKTHLTKPISEDELQKIREQELENSAAITRLEKVVQLHYPDGEVNKHEQDIINEITPLISKLNPEIIISFGADGITGHKDHTAIHRVASSIAAEHGIPFAACCLPTSVAAEARDWLKTRRRTADHYEDELTVCEGNISIQIDGDVKLKALQCYKSQIDAGDPFAGFPPKIAETFLKEESFYINK